MAWSRDRIEKGVAEFLIIVVGVLVALWADAAWVERSDGGREVLTATDRADLHPGDAFVIETPGGGGYGPPDAAREAAE